MTEHSRPSIGWVLLTMGDRPDELSAALASLGDAQRWVVLNGADETDAGAFDADVVSLPENVGVPAGRDAGLKATDVSVVGFLDDDARGPADASERILSEFERDHDLGAVTLRLVDEEGETSRRHVPRPGGTDPDRSGEVALFLGGASAIRREAYDDVGGYFTDLFYGHEELELCWRLVDSGWKIRYLADVEVFHPRTTIERHADGWRLTGRNRVWIARRTLPWPVAIVHVLVWLAMGTLRAPAGEARRAYLRGWWSGWRMPVERRPISWRGIWRLTRLGRPPFI